MSIVAEWLKKSRFYDDHTIHLKVWFSRSSHNRRGVSPRMGLFATLIFACCKLESRNKITLETPTRMRIRSLYSAVLSLSRGETNNKQKDYLPIMTSKLAYELHCKRIWIVQKMVGIIRSIKIGELTQNGVVNRFWFGLEFNLFYKHFSKTTFF